MIDFAPYRSQITAIDLGHLALIVVVILVQLTLTIISDLTGNRLPQLWVPPLVITMLGIVTRMNTMIHRLGGFLKSQGDPWEVAKAAHKPTAYLMPIGDILCMLPVIALLIYRYDPPARRLSQKPRRSLGSCQGRSQTDRLPHAHRRHTLYAAGDRLIDL